MPDEFSKAWEDGESGDTEISGESLTDLEERNVGRVGARVGEAILAAAAHAEAYADAPVEADSVSGNYTFALGDELNVVKETVDATAQVLTVPPNSSVAFPIGAVIEVARIGAGSVTFAQGAGVTIQPIAGNFTIPTQYGVASIRKRATNIWHLVA